MRDLTVEKKNDNDPVFSMTSEVVCSGILCEATAVRPE
jgi:hypothetical protein